MRFVGALPLVLCTWLIGCVAHTPDQKTAVTEQLAQGLASQNELGHAIFGHPDVASAAAQYVAAQANAAEVGAAKRTLVNATGTAGVSSEIDKGRAPETEPAVTVGLNASRILADGGRLAARQAEVDTDVAIAGARLGLATNDVLVRLSNAIVTQNSAEKTIALIKRALGKYNQHAGQIDAAEAAGVLTNAEVLQIRLAHNNIENRLLDAELVAAQANVDITEVFFSAQNAARAQTLARAVFAKRIASTPPDTASFRIKAADLGVTRSRAAKQSAQVSTKPQTRMVAALNAPADTNGGMSGFVGVRIDLTIADGGASARRAEALEASAEAGTKSALALRAQIHAQDARSAQTQSITTQQRSLLQQRLALSRKRLGETEQLLLAGRANVATMAQETLAASETEVSLVELDQRLALARIARFGARGAGCALFDLCDGLRMQIGVVE